MQKEDPFWGKMINYMTYGNLDGKEPIRQKIISMAKECFFENNILWRRLNRHESPRTFLCVPSCLGDQLVQQAHGHLLVGHNGMKKTKERLLQSYYWPNMDSFI